MDSSQIVFILSAAVIIHVLAIPPVTSRRFPRPGSTGDDLRSAVTQDHHGRHRERRSSKTKTSPPTHHDQHSCGRVNNNDAHSISPSPIYPLCDWCYSVNHNANRTPETIYEASCCSRNINEAAQTLPRTLQNKICETIYYNVLVSMKKHRHADHGRHNHETVKDERKEWYRAAVGCTPAEPYVPVHRSVGPSTS